MNLKKNALSYVAWMLILLFTGASFAFFGMIAAHLYDFNSPIIAVGFIVIFFGVVCLVYFLTGCIVKCINPEKIKFSPEVARFVERALFVLCIIGGAAIRIYLLPTAGEVAAYYEISKVTGQNSIPVQAVQGSVYYYCMLLHGLFVMVGNHWIAGIFLQIILQIVGTTFMYFAVRRLTDKWPAIFVLVFMCFAPVSVREGLTYSPQILYFCIFALVFLLVADYLRRSEVTEAQPVLMWVYTVIIGVAIGFACYVDVAGVVLLLPVLCLLNVKREEGRPLLWLLRFLLILVTAVGFFALFILVDSFLSGTTFFSVLNAWIVTYGSIALNTGMLTGEINIELPILICFMAFGVLSFWCRKHVERFTLFILMAFGICLLHFSSVTADNMDGRYLLYVLLASLAGVCIMELFHRENKEIVRKKAKAETAEDRFVNMINKHESEAEKGLTADVKPDEKKKSTVQFIENPLPLPKKHVKKVLDYAVIPEADMMDYDIEVSESDDFDIKE